MVDKYGIATDMVIELINEIEGMTFEQAVAIKKIADQLDVMVWREAVNRGLRLVNRLSLEHEFHDATKDIRKAIEKKVMQPTAADLPKAEGQVIGVISDAWLGANGAAWDICLVIFCYSLMDDVDAAQLSKPWEKVMGIRSWGGYCG